MLGNLTPQAPDKIIELMAMFRADPRPGKLDLGVGVYKDAAGKTPVMRAVKAAEKRLLETQETKTYLALLGDLGFIDAMRELVLGPAIAAGRVAGAQTPGGTGAVHLLLELVRMADPHATVWISEPTWPNHPAILKHLGVPFRTYRYFDPATGEVDREGMLADLARMDAGDVVLLHGCCHNPTGANLGAEDWRALTALLLAKSATPLIDLAYQGFGDGLEADVAGLRAMAAEVPEMLIAASCSKNFGVYRDRVGAALILSPDEGTAALARGAATTLNRLNYSFPPDHGAALVGMILTDPWLRAEWQGELEEMRQTMLTLRQGLAAALRQATNSGRFDFVARHRGMFSRLGISAEAVAKLRADHGIYMVSDSRINIAGLPAGGLEMLARAIAEVA
jgi:aromatic-amino-acid transaminase